LKVYLFYICDREMSDYYAVLPDTVNEDEGLVYALYAYTNSKKDANLFKRTRKKDIFYTKEVKMSKNKYEKFLDQHPDQALSCHYFTGTSVSDKKIKPYQYPLLSTVIEYETVSYHGYDYILEELSVLSDEYLENSKKIFKPYIHHILKETIIKQFEVIYTMPIDDDYENYFTINELEVYMYLFGNTYTKEGVYENALLQIL